MCDPFSGAALCQEERCKFRGVNEPALQQFLDCRDMDYGDLPKPEGFKRSTRGNEVHNRAEPLQIDGVLCQSARPENARSDAECTMAGETMFNREIAVNFDEVRSALHGVDEEILNEVVDAAQ